MKPNQNQWKFPCRW